jgi:hypothetical protein
VDKEYTAGEAKAWLNGYDEGKKIRMSERSIQISDKKEAESARAWVGLTTEEIMEITGVKSTDSDWNVTIVHKWIREIEAKLKERNNG